ncbi:MAG: DUF3842 family protein, partial [Firmicutes bacterium]|nr:DUF3842 family protein [Bacillota bacterium]
RAIVERIKKELPEHKVLALGTNAMATGQMLKAGADDGATGENAIVYNMPRVDIVCGVVAILNANAMLGELTPKMAEAIGSTEAYKILLPLNRCHIHVISVQEAPLGQHIDGMIAEIRRYTNEHTEC